MNEEMDEMLPGLRRRSNSDARSLSETLSASPNVERVGESAEWIDGALCSNFESKKGRDSSNESDWGRGMAPLTVVASNPCVTSRDTRKSMASFTPPALLRVYVNTRHSSSGDGTNFSVDTDGVVVEVWGPLM